jgi:hypothetical protein
MKILLQYSVSFIKKPYQVIQCERHLRVGILPGCYVLACVCRRCWTHRLVVILTSCFRPLIYEKDSFFSFID